jgi:hypothetical protein
LSPFTAPGLKHLDASTPSRFLVVVDLAQVKNLPLDHSPICTPVILHNAPIPVFFPVLDSPCVPQEHGPIVYTPIGQSRGWVFTTSDFGNADVHSKGLTVVETAKIAKNRAQLSKSG